MSIKNKILTELSYINSPLKRKLITRSKSFKNKTGLEIGGPSSIFRVKGVFPVYVYAQTINGVNFSNNTIWEGKLTEGKTFNYFEKKTGYQYIAEATDLSRIESKSYDFVLSSHSLEHTANPLRALAEWNRVLKNHGQLVLVLPDKNSTFDVRRPYTTFEHLIEDYNENQDEHDTTHLSEIVELHDFTRDSIQSMEMMKQRLSTNFENRSAHHHVFSFELIKQILEFSNFEVTYQQSYPPFHMVTIATKNN